MNQEIARGVTKVETILIVSLVGSMTWIGVVLVAVGLIAGTFVPGFTYNGGGLVAGLYFIVALVLLGCFVAIYRKYRASRRTASAALALAYLFLAVALFFLAFFFPFLAAVEIWAVCLNEMNAILIGFAFINMGYFVFEVFLPGGMQAPRNRRRFAFMSAACVLFLLFITFDILTLPGPELTLVLIIVTGAPGGAALLYILGLMATASFRMARKDLPREKRTGFQLIGSASLLYMVGLIFMFAFNLTRDLTSVYESSPGEQSVLVVGLVLVVAGALANYVGYVYPQRRKKGTEGNRERDSHYALEEEPAEEEQVREEPRHEQAT